MDDRINDISFIIGWQSPNGARRHCGSSVVSALFNLFGTSVSWCLFQVKSPCGCTYYKDMYVYLLNTYNIIGTHYGLQR